ncbi:DUF6942 family protein [Alteromonas lipolytica]|uniref:Uncharacterized protein n=1 Tax=Alteromonas lipolytica TaxID=1856405 RepID=A0A1E8FJ12_9ALTE|nr:hypothetical protein [Alteromonas lipolytica]OFI35598.1 hypothetical protein BFC17_12645 [Alteromonas lipolytica]GGF77493.1 hypothetical protein GCM10011338_32310 [Alteromonas lipolytica]
MLPLTDPDIIALGDEQARIRVYIGNRPDTVIEHVRPGVSPLLPQDIYRIGQACGNGWRKVFNVYAKLVFALPESLGLRGDNTSWQAFRDNRLLQAGSGTALWFGVPGEFTPDVLHIVTGKTYANSLTFASSFHWETPEFALDLKRNLVVCPYFDYRQLSNSKILFLIELLNQLHLPMYKN